jgi:hypothetical protein
MTNAFITALETEGQTLISAAETAWSSAKADLASLEATVLSDISSAIQTVFGGLSGGESIEDIETAVLNLLEGEVTTLLKSFSSGALQALIVFAKAAL